MSKSLEEPLSRPAGADIEKVLTDEKIAVFFQPVVSVRGKSILGFEAFSRSIGGEGARLDAQDLFAQPWSPAVRLRLCRLCRRKALEAFRPIAERHPHMLIFLNVDAIGITAAEKPGHLSAICEAMGLDGRRVIIELERPGLNSQEVYRFVQFYRERGFKLSIDAMDGLSAPTEELFSLKPDYIKLDRASYTDVEGKEFKREMVTGLCRMAERLGSVVVAKNVETEEEATRLLEWGVNIQQGYCYTKDKDCQEKDPIRAFLIKVEEINRRFRERAQAEVAGKRKRFEDFHKILRKVGSKLGESILHDFPALTDRYANAEESLLCVYVLDDNGVQITPRAFKKSLVGETPMLGPERGKGEDMSIREDVLHLKSGFDKYVSQPFISIHARVPACTISARFYNRENVPCILCLEFLSA
ncbi:MAG: EAL domain-containing protein [Humidesulfovibrio sp.]|nr:EAL domain-containing protein [Humidesulfovibrio sp.]